MRIQRSSRLIAVVALALASITVAVPGRAAPDTPQGPVQTADRQLAESDVLDTTALDALQPASESVTLLTGHAYEVSDVNGKTSVTQTGAPPPPEGLPAEEVMVQSVESPGQAPDFRAMVPSAADLIADGSVDPDLFNLSRLLELDDPGAVPVTVYFAGTTTADEAAATADAIPGSTLIPGTATPNSATVRVATTGSPVFWDAVTRPKTFAPDDPEGWPWKDSPPGTPRELRDGIAGITLDGAALGAGAEPALTEPTYNLDVRVHAPSDPDRWAYPDRLAMSGFHGAATSVDGPLGDGGAVGFQACEDPKCRTMLLRFIVPAGVYSVDVYGSIWDPIYANFQQFRFVEPEVSVTRDATMELFVDDGNWNGSRTTKPSEARQLATTAMRQRPDGLIVSNLGFSFSRYGPLNGHYMAPSRTTVETGSYNFLQKEARRQPVVQMRVAGRSRQPLAVIPYVGSGGLDEPSYLEGNADRYELVDGGVGSAADLDGIDADGKVVLIGIDPATTEGNLCDAHSEVVDRAYEAGAAALLLDPTLEHPDLINHSCPAPMLYDRLAPRTGSPVKLPLITVGPQDATMLRQRLANRPVRLVVDGATDQQPAYLYELVQNFWGGIPADLPRSIDDDQLATRATTLHGTANLARRISPAVFPRVFGITAGVGITIPAGPEPIHLVEHMGPVTSELVWTRQWRPAGDVSGPANVNATDYFTTATDHESESFHADPWSIGPPTRTDDFVPWGDGKWRSCSFCRSGDLLYPFTYLNHGASPEHRGGLGLLPNVELTTASGETIPLGSDRGLPAFELPPDPQEYTFRSTTSAGDEFAWTFTSGTADGDPPPHTGCTLEAVFGDPCGEAVPMIYLRYAAAVDANNLAAAGARHTVNVDAYHHDPAGPAITSVTTEVSFDGGESWRDTRMRRARDGRWQASFQVPDLAATDGFVTLRTTASDLAGNSTVQTRTHAYGLK